MDNVGEKGLGRVARRVIPAALMAYGALGVAVQLRLLPLLAEGVTNWTGLKPASAAPVILSWLTPVQGHFDGLPWLPWATWLVGTGLLVWGPPHLPVTTAPSQINQGLRWQVPIVLLLLVALGGYARMVELWPQTYGLSQRPYDDEGVYAGTSQLFLQGIMPYRDYFFAHPPVAAVAFAPAMAFHFNEWGSPTSFMIARYLSVGYSLFTLVLIFLVALQLVGLWGGVISGGLWALDGRVVEINRKVMLEGPMVMFSCAALLLYLGVRPRLAGEKGEKAKNSLLMLALAGFCAALSALTKIAGAACMVAIVADMIWLALEGRRAKSAQDDVAVAGFRLQIGSFLGGVSAAAILVLGPFLMMAPAQFVRDAFFFQLLRPSDGVGDIPSRIGNLSSTLANPLTLIFAALGFLVLTGMTWRYRITGPWRVVALWTFLSLILFTYSRSFYGHYYIQFAAPLCLLATGISLLPTLWTRAIDRMDRVWLARVGLALAALLALVSSPLLVVQWQGVAADHRGHDRIFELVGKYVSNAVPPGTQVLTTDEQFNFLAARPPSHNSTGYLIDSYGHMIALGLGLGTRDWGDLWASALRGEHSDDVYAMIRRSAPQADFLDRVSIAPLVVVHDKGFSRLTPQTAANIESVRKVVEQTTRYTIYRAERSSR